MRARRTRAIVYAVLVTLLLCFIWGQSTLPKAASAAESGRLMRLLKPFLDPYGRIEDGVFHHYLRKAAHFSEYAALGFCVTGLLQSLLWKRHPKRRVPAAVAFCVLAAAIDEGIQIFSVDRGPLVRDVLLDFVGSMFGLLVFLLLSAVIRKLRRE